MIDFEICKKNFKIMKILKYLIKLWKFMNSFEVSKLVIIVRNFNNNCYKI